MEASLYSSFLDDVFIYFSMNNLLGLSFGRI